MRVIDETRPSAGLITRSGSSGVTRIGSRKKKMHQAVRTSPIQKSGSQISPSRTDTIAKTAMNG